MIYGMTLGKSLRLRRIFANGRALIVDCDPLAGDRLGKVGLLARAGADGAVLTPGLLEAVAEDLGPLAVVLRIDGGSRRAQQLLSVQAALEMGAEAVLVSVPVCGPGPSEALERFGHITEHARRLGMPVIADVPGDDWLEVARLGVDYGADVVQVHARPEQASERHFVRLTGRPLLASFAEERLPTPDLLDLIYDLMQGAAQGLVIRDRALAEPGILQAIHALVHQGVSSADALELVQAPRAL